MKGLSIRDPLRFIEQTDALHLNERRFKYVQSRFQIELTKQNGRLQVAPKSRDSPSIHALAEYLCLFTSPQHIFTINAAVISGENFFLAAEEAENLFGIIIDFNKVDGIFTVRGDSESMSNFREKIHEVFSFGWAYFSPESKEWKSIEALLKPVLTSLVLARETVDLLSGSAAIRIDFLSMTITHLSTMTMRSFRAEITGKASFTMQNKEHLTHRTIRSGILQRPDLAQPTVHLARHLREICKRNHLSEQTAALCIDKHGRQPTSEAELLAWIMQHEEDYLVQHGSGARSAKADESEESGSENSRSESESDTETEGTRKLHALRMDDDDDDDDEGEDRGSHMHSRRRRHAKESLQPSKPIRKYVDADYDRSMPHSISSDSHNPRNAHLLQPHLRKPQHGNHGQRRNQHHNQHHHQQQHHHHQHHQQHHQQQHQHRSAHRRPMHNASHNEIERDIEDDEHENQPSQQIAIHSETPMDASAKGESLQIPREPKKHTIHTQFPSLQGRKLRAVVIDGSNVAFSHGLRKVFSSRGLQLAYEYFKPANVDIFITTPMWRLSVPPEQQKPPLTDKSILEELYQIGVLVETPSRSYEDHGVVDLAMSWDAGLYNPTSIKQPNDGNLVFVILWDSSCLCDDIIDRDDLECLLGLRVCMCVFVCSDCL
eukprot:TRINITY_DN6762_c0_g1_i6.p1 TRINITY_DN6762_c0_g1~~TRINITY_DN6762_c0_g1_i6.p1  ORF type:complete len:659 (+),score=157.13 TRINITY_DN6762_c0_g1_i6:72-2048(+)